MKRPAILFVICLYLLTSILTSTPAQALSIATSEAEITNVTFAPSAGTFSWTGPWWVQAGALADDYKSVFDTGFDPDWDTDGVADASASTTLAESEGHADGNTLKVSFASEARADSPSAWSTAVSYGELFNTFAITGGISGNPVDLTVAYDYSAILGITADPYGPIFDSKYVVRLAISDGLTDWILEDENQITGGPGSNISQSYGGTLSDMFALQYDVPYTFIISADADSETTPIPEPATIVLLGVGLLFGLPILRRNRARRQ